MGTRVVRIPHPAPQQRAGVRRLLDPAGTALMVAVSASVLAASRGRCPRLIPGRACPWAATRPSSDAAFSAIRR